jgi:EpsI family protein
VSFLNNKYAKVLTVVLLIQALAYYAVARRKEDIPAMMPLSTFPVYVGGWFEKQDAPVEKEVQDVLRADDILNRIYTSPATGEISLFIAFFKTQRFGQAPHSPKNCLPGSGWEKISDEKIPVNVPSWDKPIVINRYVVEHGDEKSVTLYWYQSHNRVIADEFAAKLWLVADSIRYHRSDTALVRVIAPVQNGNVTAAGDAGVSFIQAVFPKILQQMPL